METEIKYKVYKLDDNHLAKAYEDRDRICLIEHEFKGWLTNSFDSMEDAIEGIKSEETWQEFTILPIIRITNH